MGQRVFGASGRNVAVIGQGTWCMERDDRAGAVRALRRGLDLGLSHIDTAEMYGSGIAEEIVAEAFDGRRQEIFLVSKVLPQNASRRGTVAACERSLARLRTDHLDCYLLHWRGRHPLAETVAAFEELQRAGKIRSWGVSNFDVPDLEEIKALSDGAVCNQVLYHLQERAIEHAVIPWCAENNIAVVAYSPFGQNDFPEAATAGGKVLARIAAAHNATPRQVALRFLVRAPNVFTIPKAAKRAHVEDNAGALAFQLTPEDLRALDAAFPLGRRGRHLPTL